VARSIERIDGMIMQHRAGSRLAARWQRMGEARKVAPLTIGRDSMGSVSASAQAITSSHL
jgi:hypothetical protein